MDDNRDKRTDNSSDDSGTDGEYHFIRPEQRLYEDAEFVPQDEATEVPNYYAPEEKASGKIGRGAPQRHAEACVHVPCVRIGRRTGRRLHFVERR